MTRYGILAAAALCTMTLGAAEADAQSFGMAAIGDSISTAMDANDECGGITRPCLQYIGEDWSSSWTTGHTAARSVRVRLGLSESQTVIAQRNGARWDDALVQAQQITSSGVDVRFVSILMGANDVCVNYDDQFPSVSTIRSQVDSTFWHLATNLPAGSTVLIAEVPDVVRLYEVMRWENNKIVGSCQDAWDVGYGGGGLIGAIADMFDQGFPCGKLLRSDAPAQNRVDGRNLNQQMNSVLAEKVASYDGLYGVHFVLSADTYEMPFYVDDVTELDCFHPSRQGQINLADRVWRGVGWTGHGYTPRVVHTHGYRTSHDVVKQRIWLSEPARAHVWLQNCTDPNDPLHDVSNGYLWMTPNTDSYHEIEVGGSWLDGGDRWRIWVLPVRANGTYDWNDQYAPGGCF